MNFQSISESIRPGGRPENAAQPRSIADYDYTLKSIPDYDASDYINGDFDRVQGTPSQQRTTKIQLIPTGYLLFFVKKERLELCQSLHQCSWKHQNQECFLECSHSLQ